MITCLKSENSELKGTNTILQAKVLALSKTVKDLEQRMKFINDMSK